MECSRAPQSQPSRGLLGDTSGKGGRHDMLVGDPTSQSRPEYMVLPWLGRDASHVYLSPTCRSGGILLAWNETVFALQAEWRGRHLVAACLTNRADGRQYVFALAYGPLISTSRGELWEDLIHMCETFPSHSMLIGGDFKWLRKISRMAWAVEIGDQYNFGTLCLGSA